MEEDELEEDTEKENVDSEEASGSDDEDYSHVSTNESFDFTINSTPDQTTLLDNESFDSPIDKTDYPKASESSGLVTKKMSFMILASFLVIYFKQKIIDC